MKIMCAVLSLLSVVMSALSIFPINVHAFKMDTHVWVAQQVLNDVVDDGYVEIHPYGKFLVIPGVADALRSNPNEYLTGSLGPDAFPDLVGGQMTTHPGLDPASGGWRADDWMRWLLEGVDTEDQRAFVYGYLTHAATDVFSHTYVNLYAGDAFVLKGGTDEELRHIALESFIKAHQPPLKDGNGVMLGDGNPATVLGGMSADFPAGYLSKKLILDPNAAEQYRKVAATIHLAAMYDFWKAQQNVIDTIETARSEVNSKINEIDGRIDDVQGQIDNFLNQERRVCVDLGFTEICKEIRYSYYCVIDPGTCVAYYSTLLPLKASLEFTKVTLLAAYNSSSDSILYPMKAWQGQVETATKEYIRTSGAVSRDLLRPDATETNVKDHLNVWVCNWAPVFAGVPNVVAAPVCATNNYASGVINGVKDGISSFREKVSDLLGPLGWAVDPMQKVEEKIEAELTPALRGLAVTLGDKVLGDQSQVMLAARMLMMDSGSDAALNLQFSSDYTNKGLLVLPDIADRVKAEMHLQADGNFSPTEYNVAYNAVILSKLALLPPAELSRLAINAGVTQHMIYGDQSAEVPPPLYQGSTTDVNVLFGFVGSLDGNHQWQGISPPLPRRGGFSDTSWPDYRAYGYSFSQADQKGFRFWEDCELRDRVFLKIFKGPVAPGIEVPSMLDLPEIPSGYGNGTVNFPDRAYAETPESPGNPFPISSKSPLQLKVRPADKFAWSIPFTPEYYDELVVGLDSQACGGNPDPPLLYRWSFLGQCTYRCDVAFHPAPAWPTVSNCTVISGGCPNISNFDTLVKEYRYCDYGWSYNDSNRTITLTPGDNRCSVLEAVWKGSPCLDKICDPNGPYELNLDGEMPAVPPLSASRGIEWGGMLICDRTDPATNLVMLPGSSAGIELLVTNPETGAQSRTNSTVTAGINGSLLYSDWTEVDSETVRDMGMHVCGISPGTLKEGPPPDLIPPVVTAPPDITVECTPSLGGVGLASIGTPFVWDNRDIAIQATNNHPDSFFYSGETIVTWSATDSAGNQGIADQKVKVLNNKPPQFLPGQELIQIHCTEIEGTPYIPETPKATDICSNALVTVSPLDVPISFPIGDTVITWVATSPNGMTSELRQVIRVPDANPPVAYDDSFATDQSKLTVQAPGILSNDTDQDGDPLKAILVTGPANGNLIFSTDGNGYFTYFPNPGSSGTDSFTYRASDGYLQSNIATVTVKVRVNNWSPEANPDSYTTNKNTTLNVAAPGVLANDTDGDGDPVVLVTWRLSSYHKNPCCGLLTVNPNGSFTYIPNPDFVGEDSFEYEAVDDGGKHSFPALVTIKVGKPNSPPTANQLWITTAEDTPVAITLSGTDPDGDTLMYSVVQKPNSGTLSGTPPKLTYKPSLNFNGTDAFTFKVSDGNLDSYVEMVALTVTPVYDPPVSAKDSYTSSQYRLRVGAPGVLSNDTSPEGNPLKAILVTNPNQGQLIFNENGSFDYFAYLNSPNTISFTYRASDGSGLSDIATVTLNVPVDNYIPVTVDDAYSTSANVALTVPAPGVLANDTDGDGDRLYAMLSAPPPANGRVTLNVDGSFTYNPNPGFIGTDSFNYTIGDGVWGSDRPGTATITVTPSATRPPVAADDSYSSTQYQTRIWAPGVLSNDISPDGHPLKAILVEKPTHGSFMLNEDGSVYYVADPGSSGTFRFTYQASDNGVLSNIATVTLTVPVDDYVPVAVDDAFSTVEDVALTVSAPGFLANDTDGDGDILYAILTVPPVHGTLTFSTIGGFNYTPNSGFFGTDSFTYRPIGGYFGGDSRGTVTITVTEANKPPTANPSAIYVREDIAQIITLSGTDSNGNLLTYIEVSGPSHGTLSGTPPNLTYEPAYNYNGPDSFTFKVNDGVFDSEVAAINITVEPMPDPPIASDAYVTTPSGTQGPIGLSAFDTDGDSLTYTVVSGPSHGTLSGIAPNLIYLSSPDYSGPDSFTYKVTDSSEWKIDSNIAAVSISVTPVPNNPVAIDDVLITGKNVPMAVPAPGVLGNDYDPQNGAMTVLLVGPPAYGTVVLNPDGSFTYTPRTDFIGTDIFPYQVAVGTRRSEIAVVAINVASDGPGGNTPTGANVSVSPTDPNTGTTSGTITFGNVLSGGMTTMTSSTYGQEIPKDYKIAGMGTSTTYYQISTTALYSGLIQVCIPYQGGLSFPRLWHWGGGTWIDITDPGYPNTVTKQICGTTASLSPFALVEPKITALVDQVPVSTPIQVGFRFHSGETGTWSAKWNWGDGYVSDATVTNGTATGFHEITGDYAYTIPGVYTVELSISRDGTPYVSDEYKYIVVYDPNGSFVTGGGWIQSPPGAYAAEPALTGKASFGFVSKYKKGATVPSGNTQFQFNAAGMDFVSTSYQWLVISGARAQFKGLGSINGEGAYGFLLTAIDGNVTGGGGSDMFRVKIWDPAASDAIVYDNQQGAMDDATPNTILGGGSIVIHKQ